MLSELKKKYGSDVVTPNMKNLLRDRKTLLDEFFDVKCHSFFDKSGQQIEANVVYCKNASNFIDYVCHFRGVNREEADHLIGMDEGKGRLTLTYSCIPKTADSNNNTPFKAAGVMQSFVLCCVENVPETYENAKIVFDLTHLREVECTVKIVCDLKLSNIILGLTSPASKYPCPYGECCKGKDKEWIKGESRSFASIAKHKDNWQKETNGNRKKLMDFFNCEFEPLVLGLGEELVLVHFPPPPLHLVDLGPVNNLLHSLEENVGDLTVAWEKIGVKREAFHGGNFNGNEVNKILGKLNILTTFVPSKYQGYISCLEAVGELKDSVCRQVLTFRKINL